MAGKHAMHAPSSSSYWLNCDLWYQHKLVSEPEDKETQAMARGTKLHVLAEYVVGEMRFTDVDLTSAIKSAQARYRKENKKAKNINKEDEQALRVAVNAVFELVTPDMDIELELKVPLSYEPESVGTIDVAAVWANTGKELIDVIVADHKFGETAVSPNASQLRVYAYNFLALLKEHGFRITERTQVTLAVIQPALHREAVTREYLAIDLLKFGAHVEAVVENQVMHNSVRGAGSLSTCDWCPFFSKCKHNSYLVKNQISAMIETGERPKALIEEVVKSRSVLKKVTEECVAAVATDEERFPNWRRNKVSNARKWDPLVRTSTLAAKLIAAGIKDPYALVTPAQALALSRSAKATAKVEALSIDGGQHVRLKHIDPGAVSGSGDNQPRQVKVPVTVKKREKNGKAKK